MGREKIAGKERDRGQGTVFRAARFWAGAAFAAFLAAAAIYLVLVQAEKSMLEGYEKGEVYFALKEIPEGQMITESNMDEFFLLSSVDVRWIPETALQDPLQVKNLVAAGTIEKGVLLTGGMFQPVEEITKGMKEPVIAGFRAEDLYQVVGGTLRSGDRIHIYGSEEDLGTYLIWENVYVQQVFDSGGTIIESGDTSTAAQRINIFLDKKDVEAFYTRLEQGSLRVVRIW